MRKKCKKCKKTKIARKEFYKSNGRYRPMCKTCDTADRLAYHHKPLSEYKAFEGNLGEPTIAQYRKFASGFLNQLRQTYRRSKYERAGIIRFIEGNMKPRRFDLISLVEQGADIKQVELQGERMRKFCLATMDIPEKVWVEHVLKWVQS